MVQTIRVLQVIGIMNRGGAESMIMNIYRKIDRNKIQFDFVEHTNNKALFDDEILQLGGRVFHCPQFNGVNYRTYKKWWIDFFKKNGSDYKIIHGHIGSTAPIYLSVARRYGMFTIAHSHNTKGVLSIKEIAYRMISRQVRHNADYFFACSKEAGLDRFGKNVNFKILNNAIDIDRFLFDKEIRKEVRSEFGINDEIVLGHVGRFSMQKNHRFLIEIFIKIRQHANNVKLILVGEGELKNEMISFVKKVGLEKDVIFTGVRSDVNRLFQAMDIFVFPSYFEGLPVTLVEAQASGIPCVISENIPKESVIVHKLVTIKSLNDAADEWAKSILSINYSQRQCMKRELIDKGFDINETAKWMENFYYGHGK